jgi:dihydroorotate dehydrogenase
MSWLYRRLLRPFLFAQDAERIHERAMRGLTWVGNHPAACDALESFLAAPDLPLQLFGLRFPNPVGLAAGMDKYATALPAWPALGFGFTELGAVTRHPQPGNPEPRLFRAISEEAIINRMGFNNPGAQVVAERLASWRAQGRWPRHPVGINLGKSKITPLEKAPEDYATSFRILREHADFFVVNVSSPNTPNLRQLQDKTALDEILAAINEAQIETTAAYGSPSPRGEGRGEGDRDVRPSEQLHGNEDDYRSGASRQPRPILVKVAPDLSFEALDEILEVAATRNLAGIVATNTTITRPATDKPDVCRIYEHAGGLSGKPLRARSTEVIRHLYRQTRAKLPIIGVGGIFNPDDAWEKITAGAALLQIYTGLIYEGPSLAKNIVTGLLQRLEENGLTQIEQAVGIGSGP